MLLGIANDGRVLGVRVLSHGETPGLGDKIEPQKSDWLAQFQGQGITPDSAWQVAPDGGDVDALTGATITSRAMLSALKKTLIAVQQHGNRWQHHATPCEAQT